MRLIQLSLTLTVVGLVSSCGGGSGSSADQSDIAVNVSSVTALPEGDVMHYGAITVSDDIGVAFDVVGSFYTLGQGVSADYLLTMLNGETTHCQIQDDGVVDFEEISVGFTPYVPDSEKQMVSAGDAVVLSTPSGTYVSLQEQTAGSFLFYDLPSGSQLPQGSIPDELVVSVTGSQEIPPFMDALVPTIPTLTGVNFNTDSSVSINTRFSWEPSGNPQALVRIQTQTAGGFFREDGVSVACVTPDSGTFTFPPGIQSLLGEGFVGEPPIMSRLLVNATKDSDTVLFVVRESFAEEF